MKKYFFLFSLIALLFICQGAWAQSGSWLDEANLPENKNFSEMGYDDDGNPFIKIKNEEELALLAYTSKKQHLSQANTIFILEKDLDMSAHYWVLDLEFKGRDGEKAVFDGNGHTISGIHVNGQDNSTCVGLFGLVSYAEIKNLKITNSNIAGDERAGAIVGIMNINASIENCYVGSNVSVSAMGAGGIAGYVGSTNCSIVGCVSAASVSGTDVAGLVSLCDHSTLKDCLYIGNSLTGNTRGALIATGGSNDITNCFFTDASLINLNDNDVLAYTVSGGTEGLVIEFETPDRQHGVSGISAFETGGMVYDGKRYSANEKIVEFFVSSSNEESIVTNVKANNTPIDSESGNKYRLTISSTNYVITCEFVTMSWDGEGTNALPYLIYTRDDMNLLATLVNAGKSLEGKSFRLMNDLSYSGYDYVPVGINTSFTGTFDGQGKTISGLNITRNTISGVFGFVSGTVKNLRLANSTINGGQNTGGIVGNNSGSVTNCHVGNDVVIAAPGAFSHHGGIVGYNRGTIEGCTSAASVTYSSEANGYGGIVGNNGDGGTVKNCLYLGSSVSAGSSTYVGAIAGYDYNSTFTNNLYHLDSDNGLKAIGDETPYDNENAARGYSITSGTDGLTLNYGTPYTTYDYNGIALYTNGMLFDGVFYTKGNSVVDFIADFSPGNKTGLKASSGTLVVGSEENAFTLTMDNADVIIKETAYYLICSTNHWSPQSFYRFALQEDGSCRLYTLFSGDFKILDEDGNELGGTGLGVGTPSVTLDPNGPKLNIAWETYYTFVIKDGVLTVSGWPHDNYIYVNRPNMVSRSILMTEDADGNWVAKNVQINDGYWFKPAKMVGGNLAGAALYGCDGESMEIAESQMDEAIDIYPGNGYGQFMLPEGYYTMKVSADFTTLTVTRNITLENNASNASLITSNDGRKADVKLNGRTFAKNGSWFPLCLPFDVDDFDGTPLEGAVVKEFNNSGFNQGTLYLGFKDVSKIEAGKPYLVKWVEEGQSVVNPEFHAVVIKDELHPKGTGAAQFVGSYDPVVLQADNRKVLYIGAKSTLYYPQADVTLGALRCYFYLYNIEAGEPREGGTTSANKFVLTFDDGETSGIESLDNLTTSPFDGTDAIYDLQGRKADGSTLTKGIYIVNGKKVVIK